MLIVGCDLHARYQQFAMLDTATGELVERQLEHENGEARAFYAALPGPVRVRVEATGYTHWFERMPGAPSFSRCQQEGRAIRRCRPALASIVLKIIV